MVLRTIAVGVDGSEAANAACRWAAGLANTSTSLLRVVSVWDLPFVCTHPWSAPTPDEAVQHARAVIRSALDDLDVTGQVESVVLQGPAGPTLTSEANGAGLLVVGRTGEGLVAYKPQFGEVLAGSTARYCANHASVPVAAVNPGSHWVNRPTVVIGVDGSPASLNALSWATRELPDDSTFYAVMGVMLPATDAGSPIDYELLDPVVDEHLARLRSMVADNVHPGASVTSHVVLGHSRDALIDPGFIYDLIVVGEHGETATPVGALGSVADFTLRYAPVPIVIVPAP